jgi:hypothetical protein
MPTDGQTDMTKQTVAFRNLTHLTRSHLLSIFQITECVNNKSTKFRGNSPVRNRSKPGGQREKEQNLHKLFRIGRN